MARTEDRPGPPAGEPERADEEQARTPDELDALAEAGAEGIEADRPSRGKGGRLRGALDSVLPRSEFADQRDIMGGAGQNVIGLAAGVLATFVTQIVMTRTLHQALFGVVTVTTQFAFIASTATRFGMDVANVRLVAILQGRRESGRVRALVRKSLVISGVVSLAVGLAVFLLASWLSSAFVAPSLHQQGKVSFWAAALAIPFAAVTWAYLGGTRGLKIMRHTLYIFWIGQPVGWVLIAVAGWFVSKSAGVTSLAYALSWVLACLAAWWAWERETRG